MPLDAGIIPKRITPDILSEKLAEIHPLLRPRTSERARRVSLKVDLQNRSIDLVIPKRCSAFRALEFARLQKHWITQKIADLPPVISLETANTLPLFGVETSIIRTFIPGKRTQIKWITDGVSIASSPTIEISTNLDYTTPRFIRFLREEIKARAMTLACKKASLINAHVLCMTVKDMKSRWGSCSHDGHLTLNWRLIFAPYATFDYVIAHEVAHLAHFNHSRDFWRICAEISDDFATGKGWLDRHGKTLSAYVY